MSADINRYADMVLGAGRPSARENRARCCPAWLQHFVLQKLMEIVIGNRNFSVLIDGNVAGLKLV
jgi:hypothetical protein